MEETFKAIVAQINEVQDDGYRARSSKPRYSIGAN